MAMEHKPDLITLDNILPDMIGTDILRVLKNDEKIESKVVMISAVGQESVIQEGMSLGASNYIVKPFTAESLVETINKVFA
jgi:two-component system chemotaxis response regulator CheY